MLVEPEGFLCNISPRIALWHATQLYRREAQAILYSVCDNVKGQIVCLNNRLEVGWHFHVWPLSLVVRYEAIFLRKTVLHYNPYYNLDFLTVFKQEKP